MAKGSKAFVLAGPWKGMEERENLQGDDHCQHAYNVDFSRGYIESRKGFEAINISQGVGTYPKMHVIKKEGKPHRILTIGIEPSGSFKGFLTSSVWTLEGVRVGTFELDRELNLQPRAIGQDFDCSFLDVFIAREGDSGTRDQARAVTLIVTEYTTYMYDPVRSELAIWPIDMEKDSIRFREKNWAYWDNPPGCKSAVEHKSYYVYAGFRDGYFAKMHREIAITQSVIFENLVDQGSRGGIYLGPQHFVLSDPADPLGIIGFRIFAVDQGESVVAVVSYMEQLMIFTDKGIYSLTGATDETFSLFKVVSGIGCIAKNSIVETNNILYFMSHDGIYAYQGMGPESVVVKVSKPIDSTFTHNMVSTYVNPYLEDAFGRAQIPFRADMGQCKKSQALHVQGLNQIWWSLPCMGDKVPAAQSYPAVGDVILVFDYAAQAWSFHFSYGRFGAAVSDANTQELMYSGVRFVNNGKEEIVTAGRWQSDVTYLMKYGGAYDGRSNAKENVAMVYITGRLFKQNSDPALFRPIRLKVLSASKDSGVRWMLDGEEAHGDAQYVKADGTTVADTPAADRQAQDGVLVLHQEVGGDAFWNTGTWGSGSAKTFKYASRDWFTSKIENASLRSRSMRLGLVAQDAENPGELVLQSIQVEVEGGDSR